MIILERFTLEAGEVQDFDIPFTDYLAQLSDTGLSHIIVADAGVTINSSTLTSGVVKVWVTGLTKGTNNVITAELTTTGGRVHFGSIKVKVRS